MHHVWYYVLSLIKKNTSTRIQINVFPDLISLHVSLKNPLSSLNGIVQMYLIYIIVYSLHLLVLKFVL